MKKIIYFLVGLGLTFSLLSCDPYGGYEFRIDNRSDTKLYVVWRLQNNDSIHTLPVSGKEELWFYRYESHNGIKDLKDWFLHDFDSLSIYRDTANKVEILKNYRQRSSWSYTTASTGLFGKAGENYYTLMLEEKDIK
jgi:hypothetical protein